MGPRGSHSRLRARQVRVVEHVVRWYLREYHCGEHDPGVPTMFCDKRKVGSFAVSPEGLRQGRDQDLFRLLVATAMFQRLRDVQILQILRGIRRADVLELTSPTRLIALVDQGGCDHMQSTEALQFRCDLAKDPISRTGTCRANHAVDCHLKRHTELLRRYGHFGKMPTSIALMLREANVTGLRGIRESVFRATSDPRERARELEQQLSRAWRVSEKISAMFLSAVATPDLSSLVPPWSEGLDWTYFVVIDSNVDLFMSSIGYDGPMTYNARREFVQKIAQRIDLRRIRPTLHAYNPRLVQQAMYIFMSAANRRVVEGDCSRQTPSVCSACPQHLSSRCPLRGRFRRSMGRR